MRLLFIATAFPYPLKSGQRIRIFKLVRALAELGHAVDLICLADANDDLHAAPVHALTRTVSAFPRADIGAPSRYTRAQLLRHALSESTPLSIAAAYTPALADMIATQLAHTHYDAIWLDSLMLAHNLPARHPPLIVDFDDVESVVEARALALRPLRYSTAFEYLDLWKRRRYERRMLRRAATVLLASEHDRRRLKLLHAEVVPNTIDLPACPIPQPGNDNELLYFGILGYGPNRDALYFFHEHIWPSILAARPSARLRIAGENPGARIEGWHDGRQVEVMGFVPDLRGLIAQAGVVIVPLRIGGGTRIKILEAMALGKAVVSTRIGAEGLELTSGENAYLTDAPADFATACIELMGSTDRRAAMGCAARVHATRHFADTLLPTRIARALARVAS